MEFLTRTALEAKLISSTRPNSLLMLVRFSNPSSHRLSISRLVLLSITLVILSTVPAGISSTRATFEASSSKQSYVGLQQPATSFDFQLSLPSPDILYVVQGRTSPPSTITATLTSGSPTPVTFSINSTLPLGITANLSNNPCIPSCKSTVSFSAASTAALVGVIVKIGASGGGVVHYEYLSLTVETLAESFAYTLSVSPSKVSMPAGSSRTVTVTGTLTGGTARSVHLAVDISPNPSACQAVIGICGGWRLSHNDFTPTSTGATSTLAISTTTVFPVGVYTLNIYGISTASGQPFASVVLTLTITTPFVSIAGCSQNYPCSVRSNATVSNVNFADNTIHFEADGPSGTHGYANVTIPKSAVPNLSDLHVFVDHFPISNSFLTITSNSTDYFAYITFVYHSPVQIDIQLAALEQAAPNILGLNPTIFYGLIGLLVVVVVAFALLAVRKRRSANSNQLL